MHTLEVRHLRLVVAVADGGNLTRAGERLHLTQSAVSRQLIEVEERLGTRLFERGGRVMAPTEAGGIVLMSARRLLPELRNTEEALQEYAIQRRGVIRMATECYDTSHWLPAVVSRFMQGYPGIDIRIGHDAAGHQFEALLEGAIEVALVLADTAPEGIVLSKLFDGELLLAVGRSHALAERAFIQPRELLAETLVSHSRCETAMLQKRVFTSMKLPRSRVQVRATETVVALVEAGVGAAILPGWILAPYAGVLAGVRITEAGVACHWHVARSSARPLSAHLHSWITLLSECAPGRMPARRFADQEKRWRYADERENGRRSNRLA